MEAIISSYENMEYLMSPRSVAIIGCSEKNMGGVALSNLLNMGYEGEIYPVHPKNNTVYGLRCYSSISELPDGVECAVIALKSTRVKQTLKELNEKNVKAAVILASGFAEVNEEGQKEQQEISQLLKENGIAACGPNCLGLINVNEMTPLYSADAPSSLIQGEVGLVSHSGSACIALMSSGSDLGFSYVISAGNEVGITTADYFRFLIEDEKTNIVVGVLESIKNPKEMSEVAELARKKGKPIIILKVGKSETGEKTALSHTGAIIGSSHLHEAFLKQNGFIEVSSYDEIITTTALLSKHRLNLPKNNGIGVMAISGGQLALSCDIAESAGLQIPDIEEKTKEDLAVVLPEYATISNPLDGTSDALFNTEIYKKCVIALTNDPNIDLLAICQDATSGLDSSQSALYQNVARAIADVSKSIKKPIVVFTHVSGGLDAPIHRILNSADIPLLQGAHASMKAIKKYIDYANSMDQLSQRKKSYDQDNRESLDLYISHFKGTSLSENESKRVLSRYEIPVTAEKVASKVEEARDYATEIGFPVAMKIDSPDILHKTEAKAVKLSISEDQKVISSFSEIMENAKKFQPDARINGVLIQEMVPKGIETIVAVKNDPLYGHYVTLGIGGTLVEMIKDFSIRILPIDQQDAYEMIHELKYSEIFKGYRGSKKADIDELAHVILKLSNLAIDHKNYFNEIEINPLVVLEEGRGVKAVDALITINR
ncbi:acetate--CoA ligase family protein [Virgibacillus byunsanensis]